MNMRQIASVIFFLMIIKSYGQTLDKGIYRGQKLPFEICYMTCNDSIIEVEYFFQKSGHIFGHLPSEKLLINMESFSTKPVYKSPDDSVLVYLKSDCYLIKRKGSGKIKVFKTTDTRKDIYTLRNRYNLFRFSQDLHNEFKLRDGFNDKEFWENLNSYGLEKYTTIDSIDFNLKLMQTKDEILKTSANMPYSH